MDMLVVKFVVEFLMVEVSFVSKFFFTKVTLWHFFVDARNVGFQSGRLFKFFPTNTTFFHGHWRRDVLAFESCLTKLTLMFFSLFRALLRCDFSKGRYWWSNYYKMDTLDCKVCCIICFSRWILLWNSSAQRSHCWSNCYIMNRLDCEVRCSFDSKFFCTYVTLSQKRFHGR